MKGLYNCLTPYLIGTLIHGGFQWKCVGGHLIATLSGIAEDIYAVSNHKPLMPTFAAFVPPNPPMSDEALAKLSKDEQDKVKAQYQATVDAAALVYRDNLSKQQQEFLAYAEQVEAEHDAAVIIAPEQTDFDVTNPRCFCGQEIQK